MILQNWCIIQLIEGEIKRRLSPEMSSKVWRDATLRLARMHEEHLRRYTCANADICDYRIVGDESEEVNSLDEDQESAASEDYSSEASHESEEGTHDSGIQNRRTYDHQRQTS